MPERLPADIASSSTLLIGASILLGLFALVMLLLVFNYGQLWFQAYWSKAQVTFLDLLGMSLRKVNAARTLTRSRSRNWWR